MESAPSTRVIGEGSISLKFRDTAYLDNLASQNILNISTFLDKCRRPVRIRVVRG
jgi:hypothetical protein